MIHARLRRTLFSCALSMQQHILQEDNFIPTLSVWETLAVTTQLRLPATVGSSMRAALMDATLSDMGLQKVKHSQVRLHCLNSCKE